VAADEPIHALHAISRTFGKTATWRKGSLLRKIAKTKRFKPRDLLVLHDTLDFMRAYPDDADLRRRVLDQVARLREHAGPARLRNTGFPGSTNTYAYSYGVLQQMVGFFPGCLEVDWEEVEDEQPLLDALELLVTPGENQGLEDIRITLREWLDRCKADPGRTDLEFLLDLFDRSPLPPQVRVHLFETCDLPVRYDLRVPGTGRCEVSWPAGTIHYQKRDVARERFPLAPRIRRPIGTLETLDVRSGAALVGRSLAALCSRNLEIYPLIYANSRDVVYARCGRGLHLALVGVQPEFRSPLESLYFFLLLKNGVPIAYGPASVFAGCCEMGINLFPEYRGGEIRYLYAQFMRVLHHHLGVEYFFLTSYGMGEGNEDAIKSGAFWFYRKLGFRAANPDVEALARREEARMREEPGYRSDRRMLRRLAPTAAYLDLSDGRRTPVDFGRLGIAQSRYLTEEFGGDRERGETRGAARGARVLKVDRAARATRRLAPLLGMIPDLGRWSARDRARLARALRAKDGRSEVAAARLFNAHETFRAAIDRLGE
jgi:hypothetical protein